MTLRGRYLVLVSTFAFAGCSGSARDSEAPTARAGTTDTTDSTDTTDTTVADADFDCRGAFADEPAARCRRIECPERYASFVGTWTGPFEAYVRELSNQETAVYRPYDNTVTYEAADCRQREDSGDVFIVGHQTDVYPAFKGLEGHTETSLLITGRHADGTRFLRTVGGEGTHDYQLVEQDESRGLSHWRLEIPAQTQPCPTTEDPDAVCQASPPMTFDLLDSDSEGTQPGVRSRDVTITMIVGSPEQPFWQGTLVRGHHVRK